MFLIQDSIVPMLRKKVPSTSVPFHHRQLPTLFAIQRLDTVQTSVGLNKSTMLTSTYAMHQSTNTKSNAAIDSTCHTFQVAILSISNDALLLATGRSSLRQHAADTRKHLYASISSIQRAAMLSSIRHSHC